MEESDLTGPQAAGAIRDGLRTVLERTLTRARDAVAAVQAREAEGLAKAELTKTTPPGISEATAHRVKREYGGDKGKAYATMWAIHNRVKGKKAEKALYKSSATVPGMARCHDCGQLVAVGADRRLNKHGPTKDAGAKACPGTGKFGRVEGGPLDKAEDDKKKGPITRESRGEPPNPKSEPHKFEPDKDSHNPGRWGYLNAPCRHCGEGISHENHDSFKIKKSEPMAKGAPIGYPGLARAARLTAAAQPKPPAPPAPKPAAKNEVLGYSAGATSAPMTMAESPEGLPLAGSGIPPRPPGAKGPAKLPGLTKPAGMARPGGYKLPGLRSKPSVPVHTTARHANAEIGDLKSVVKCESCGASHVPGLHVKKNY